MLCSLLMGRTKTNHSKGLSHGDEKFRRLLEAAPDAMVIVDRTGRILLINSQTESMFGYTRQELLDRPVEILIPEHFHRRHQQDRDAYYSAPHPRPMGSGLDLLGRRKDGSTFPVEISLSPLEDPGGGVLVTAAIRDVTKRKRAEEALRQSEERFRLVVEEVKDYAIFMLDPSGRIVSWNEGAQKIKGYTSEEIIGQHFSRFYTSEDVQSGKPDEELTVAAAEGRYEEEGWRLRKDGSRFWADVVITALHDKGGNLAGFTKVTRDITEGKRAREAFLLEVTNALVSNLDIQQLLSAIASCVRQVKAFDYATLALYDQQSRRLRMHVLEPAAGVGASWMMGEEPLVSLGKSPAGWAYITRKPLLLKGQPGETWAFETPPQWAQQSLKSGCWIPLIGREGVMGTLNVFSRRPGNFTDDDVTMLTQIAGQVAIAMGNALAFQQLSELKDQLSEQKQYLEDELKTEFNFEEIIGHSRSIRRVLKQVETVAATDSTVLILGETGTGKELLARVSSRSEPAPGPWVCSRKLRFHPCGSA